MWGHYLLRKRSLILKVMSSQAGQQIITIHILPNMSKSKGNQPIKYKQLIEYNVTNMNITFQNHVENEAGRLALDLFLVFKKALYKTKASDHLSFNIFW